jgi:hypothetical protein
MNYCVCKKIFCSVAVAVARCIVVPSRGSRRRVVVGVGLLWTWDGTPLVILVVELIQGHWVWVRSFSRRIICRVG